MKILSLACCLLVAPASHAAVFIHTQTFPDTPASGFSQPLLALTEIPFFDTGLGTLESITASFSGTLSGSMFVQNANPFPVSGQLGFTSGFSINYSAGPSLGGASMGLVTAPVTLEAAPPFNPLEPSPAPIIKLFVGPAAVTGSFTVNSGDPSFYPYGVLGGSLLLSAGPGFPILGVGTASEQATIGGTLTVTYNYTPVPEPANTGTALTLALSSWAVWRRRPAAR